MSRDLKVHWDAGVAVAVCGRAKVKNLSVNRQVVTCGDCRSDDEFRYGRLERLRNVERRLDEIFTQRAPVTEWGKRVEDRLAELERG